MTSKPAATANRLKTTQITRNSVSRLKRIFRPVEFLSDGSILKTFLTVANHVPSILPVSFLDAAAGLPVPGLYKLFVL